MLREPLALLDIKNVEAFCGRVLERHLTRTRSFLQPHDREDLHAWLVAVCWELSGRYDPSLSATSFSTYANRVLGARAIDWTRSRFGRTKWQFADGKVYERERQQPLSLDGPAPGADDVRLVDTLGDGAGDRETGRDTTLDGLHEAGNSSLARDIALIRAAAARRARGRDRRVQAA